jgi:hypothetical protein
MLEYSIDRATDGVAAPPGPGPLEAGVVGRASGAAVI